MMNKILNVNITGGETVERGLLADAFSNVLQDNAFKHVVVYDSEGQPVPQIQIGVSIFDVIRTIRPQLFNAAIAITTTSQDKVTDNQHPQQPILPDIHGTLRYKENPIVRYLLDNGPNSMNTLAAIPFSDEDRCQFAQLIGYSKGGFDTLSYSPASRKGEKEEEECSDEEMQRSFQDTIGDMLRTDPSVRSMVAESFT